MTKVQKAIALVGAGVTLVIAGLMCVLTYNQGKLRRRQQDYEPYDSL